MSQSQIETIAADLAEREAALTAAQREAEARRRTEIDRESAEAARNQQAIIRHEYECFLKSQADLKAELISKREAHALLARELPALEQRFNTALASLSALRTRHPWLKE